MKNILGIYSAPRGHWVGDGFPVRTLFNYNSHGQQLSPFLLLDYAGPTNFEPAERPRGVGEHPHRGFETVTIVYQGEIEHRDSTGAGGKIGPGDVQWMTAASGIVHSEFHSREFTRAGGPFEVVQLWVNLPAANKMDAPEYQSLANQDIPQVDLPGGGRIRVIAGQCRGKQGPARTHTPINVWDLQMNPGESAGFDVESGHTLALVVLRGSAEVSGQTAHEGQVLVFERTGSRIELETGSGATALLLSGEPIDEPIAGHGPFVMNTEGEILQAFTDYRNGRLGQ